MLGYVIYLRICFVWLRHAFIGIFLVGIFIYRYLPCAHSHKRIAELTIRLVKACLTSEIEM